GLGPLQKSPEGPARFAEGRVDFLPFLLVAVEDRLAGGGVLGHGGGLLRLVAGGGGLARLPHLGLGGPALGPEALLDGPLRLGQLALGGLHLGAQGLLDFRLGAGAVGGEAFQVTQQGALALDQQRLTHEGAWGSGAPRGSGTFFAGAVEDGGEAVHGADDGADLGVERRPPAGLEVAGDGV